MKNLLVIGLPGSGKTTLLEKWQAEPDLSATQFHVELPERVYVERDLVLNRDGAYVPLRVDYGADRSRAAVAGVSMVYELNQWTNLTPAVEELSRKLKDLSVMTVVDASTILKVAREFIGLSDETTTPDARAIHGVMTALVEGILLADLVVLNKSDLVSKDEGDRAVQLIRHFHADVAVIKTRFADVPWSVVDALPAPPQDRSKASQLFEKFLQANPGKPGDAVLGDFFYRARRPFHPQRFQDVLRKLLHPSVCLRGYFWLATQMEWAGYISGTTTAIKIHGIGHWLASKPEAEWTEIFRQDARRQALWDSTWGDRRQEFWITGLPSFLDKLRPLLDAALLTDEEMKGGPEAWSQIPDPWPKWKFADPHHHHDHAHEHGECCGHDHEHDHSKCDGHHHGHAHDHEHDEHGHCQHHHESHEKPRILTGNRSA